MPHFGDLDASFGTLGKVTTDFGGYELAFSVAIDPTSGKIIVAGFTNVNNYDYDFALACYHPNGILDASFGTNGKVITDFNGNKTDKAFSVAIDPTSGKIIVAGITYVNNNQEFALACYHPNGDLDASFGIGGKVTTDFGGNGSVANSVAIAPSGKIIVAGYTYVNNIIDFALACYTPNGILDASFGIGGKVITDFSGNDGALSVAISPSGKIIVAGYTVANNYDYDFALACYHPNGDLDASFGSLGNGKVITDFSGNNSEQASSVAIDPKSGKIIVAGYIYVYDFALACYTPNGLLDASFGIGGIVITDFSGNYDKAKSVAIDPISGKIIVAGYTVPNGSVDFALACYNPNGILDASFGYLETGLVTTDFSGNQTDYAYSVAIAPNGKIIVAGQTYVNNNYVFALACYYGDNNEVPISNVCFPANTPITTNQGTIAIQNLDPKIHTIRNKKIELITKTITQDKYLVCFEKDALGKNVPSEKTLITKNHLIYYKGSEMKAKDFVNIFENVNKIKYNGEVLYNVLLKEHDKMMVNNLICETLHPENKIAQLYKILSDLSPTDQEKVIKEYNDYCVKNNTFPKKR